MCEVELHGESLCELRSASPIGAGQSPTCLLMRPGQGQWPSSFSEMVAVNCHGWGPHSKGACRGHYLWPSRAREQGELRD
jgi:hypothetical protein